MNLKPDYDQKGERVDWAPLKSQRPYASKKGKVSQAQKDAQAGGSQMISPIYGKDSVSPSDDLGRMIGAHAEDPDERLGVNRTHLKKKGEVK